jgi:methylthioribose-1-phosphate isomerase
LQTITEDDGAIVILDQTRLPGDVVFRYLSDVHAVADAIRSMQVRGAPLIGATAAYAIALALQKDAADPSLESAIRLLIETRPTAVNLRWALDRMAAVLRPLPETSRSSAAWQEARAIAAEDAAANFAIGQHGLAVLQSLVAGAQPLNIATHCNAGWLATVAHGTALAPIYAAHESGIRIHVWVSETRPRNQGLLTAWELAQAGVPHTLIADNAAGLLMMQGRVDCVIVGADRVATNGDVANKIGTYLKALAAKAHGIPFYVATPISTIDFDCADGNEIVIEQRSADELGAATLTSATQIANPAFDITPTHLISGIITERGIFSPQDIRMLKP